MNTIAISDLMSDRRFAELSTSEQEHVVGGFLTIGSGNTTVNRTTTYTASVTITAPQPNLQVVAVTIGGTIAVG